MAESEKMRELEGRLRKAADQLRANSNLRAADYSIPVLGLIFLRYADVRSLRWKRNWPERRRVAVRSARADYQAKGVMYVPETARFSYLQSLPEGSDIGQAINWAMETLETENPDLNGVLPRDYARFDNSLLAELLRLIGSIPDDIEGDAFGKIYEYFLSNVAFSEGQRGGEFFTPISIVKLIVEIIDLSRAASSIPPVGREPCSSSRRGSSRSTRRKRGSCRSSARRESRRPCASQK